MWFRHLVNDLKIAPSESWGLDLVECYKLADIEPKAAQDTSLTVNAIREMNGCNRNKLRNLI